MNKLDIDKVDMTICESSQSRIIQHMRNPNRSFAMISPYRGAPTDATPEERAENDKENLRRYQEMKGLLRQKGLGYIETLGGYKEGGVRPVVEKSFFIPNISKQDAMEFGIMYNQDSVLFSDGKEFIDIGTNEQTGIGKVLRTFDRDKLINTDPKDMADFWSALAKGSHRKQDQPSSTQMKKVLDMHVKNPETGKSIKVASALKYDEDHPAYKAAKSLVDRELDVSKKHGKFLFQSDVKEHYFQLERRTPTSFLTEWRVHSTDSEHDLWFRIG